MAIDKYTNARDKLTFRDEDVEDTYLDDSEDDYDDEDEEDEDSKPISRIAREVEI